MATLTRSANAGVAVGSATWCITVLAADRGVGQFTAAVSDRALFPIYLACAAISAAVVPT